jgi:hypothetical protein
VLHFLFSMFLLGTPAFVLGAGFGAGFARWKPLLLAAALGVAGLLLGMRHLPDGGDDDPRALVAVMALFTNFAGWIVGLALGAAVVRLRRRRPA